jgi:uncharacterized delta-60 repeat protein
VDFGGTDSYGDEAQAVALQCDGKIVVAGTSALQISPGGYRPRLALARLNSNGTLDTSFGSGGKVIVDYYFPDANGVAILPDGKIVVGTSYAFSFAVLRFNADGTLDSGFGSGGIGSDSTSSPKCLTVQPDGKIVQGGGDPACVLVRYNSDGSRDSSFGDGGHVIASVSGDEDQVVDAAIQADGKIVTAIQDLGSANPFHDFWLARFNVDGSFDTTFGSGGKVHTFFNSGFCTSVAVRNDGKIIAGGRAGFGTGFGLTCYQPDGSLDTSFGDGGKATTSFPEPYATIEALAIDSNGLIVAAGYADTTQVIDFALARYDMARTTRTNHAPTANAGPDQTKQCSGGSTTVVLDGTGSCDPDGDQLTYQWSEGPTSLGSGATLTTSLLFGSHAITLTVIDPSGATSQDTVSVTVSDTTAPTINGLSVDKPVLWPPTHQMVDVMVNYSVTDNCDSASSISSTLSVTSSEPINGVADGDTAPDWEIVDAHHVRLRAERSARGNGRIYTIAITSMDSGANSSSSSATVAVPIN